MTRAAGRSSVVRSLSVLRHVARNGTGATLVELADELTLPASTAHRLLGILTEEEFVVRTTDKRYVLGPAALVLARGARTLEEVAHPFLVQMSDRFHETAFLAELVGRRVVCSAVVSGSRPLRLVVQRGSEFPLHATASARVILAHRDPEAVVDLIAAAPLGDDRASAQESDDAIWARFERIRELGYDYCVGELDDDVAAVSAPLRGHSGVTVASLTVAGRERGGDYEVWGQALRGYADQVETQLGVVAVGARSPAAVSPMPDRTSTQEST